MEALEKEFIGAADETVDDPGDEVEDWEDDCAEDDEEDEVDDEDDSEDEPWEDSVEDPEDDSEDELEELEDSEEAADTVMIQLAVFLPSAVVTVITAVPGALAVTFPDALTSAISGLSECQLTT